MSDLVNRLQAVMWRLEELNDLNRIGHERNAIVVLDAFAQYVEFQAREDAQIIDEAIQAGLDRLNIVRRFDLSSSNSIGLVAEYVENHLADDIQIIDEALIELIEREEVSA